jgi:hypothetical protein
MLRQDFRWEQAWVRRRQGPLHAVGSYHRERARAVRERPFAVQPLDRNG